MISTRKKHCDSHCDSCASVAIHRHGAGRAGGLRPRAPRGTCVRSARTDVVDLAPGCMCHSQGHQGSSRHRICTSKNIWLAQPWSKGVSEVLVIVDSLAYRKPPELNRTYGSCWMRPTSSLKGPALLIFFIIPMPLDQLLSHKLKVISSMRKGLVEKDSHIGG